MSHRSKNHQRFVLGLLALLPLAAHAACASSNGEAVGSQTFDASPLDPGDNDPSLPDASPGHDGATPKDAAPQLDAAEDAKPDAANTAPVQINEIYVDNAFLRGDSTEYVELRGAAGVPVDDLKLRILYADGKVKYEVAVGNAGEKFGANGLWVVGGMQTFKLNVTDHVDHPLSASVFGLDDRGAVQLVRGGVLLDVVGYGSDPDAGAVPPPLTPPTATSEGKIARTATQPASMSAPAKAIGRASAAADTNVNGTDFCTMVASPGFAQKPCE
ncbi:MAG TPA: hypothetical protein VLT33_08905 [Labilithrix sp.]|nr:hypothetical protein [Labilithrix sp.]